MGNIILAILQARVSSSRLPGKVLKPILGKSMLLHQIERILHSEKIDKLIVATSTEFTDNHVERICQKNNIKVFRGDLNNVLDRFYHCAKQFKPSHIVRLTGDCPLTDPQIIDQTIDKHLLTKSDYTSNCNPPTYPDGLDVEVISFSALKKTWENAKLPSELEHVTPYILSHTEVFNNQNVEYKKDLSAYRWTVDEPEDFEFIVKIYEELYQKNNRFNMQDIMALLKQKPHLKEINSHILRNAGHLKSYEKDKEF